MDVWNGRHTLRAVVLALVWPLFAGCTIAPKRFHDVSNPAPLVRARASTMGDGLPTGVVVPALLDRMNDADPVVRLTAHEELKQRTGRDFGFKPWDEPQPRAEAMSQWRAWWGQVTSASPRQVSGTGTATTRRATSRPRARARAAMTLRHSMPQISPDRG